MEFPITFDHLGRRFTLSLGPGSGSVPLFPRDGGRTEHLADRDVIVLDVAGDPTRYLCGVPERYNSAEVLIARVGLWYFTLKPPVAVPIVGVSISRKRSRLRPD